MVAAKATAEWAVQRVLVSAPLLLRLVMVAIAPQASKKPHPVSVFSRACRACVAGHETVEEEVK